jgi:post-segregation antitoxin (ccd killing protein)
MPNLRRKGIIYAQTCVQIPENLRNAAREQGIGLSSTLTDALEAKMKEGNARGQNATNTETPASLSSADKQVDV